jgi:hypothetical protein
LVRVRKMGSRSRFTIYKERRDSVKYLREAAIRPKTRDAGSAHNLGSELEKLTMPGKDGLSVLDKMAIDAGFQKLIEMYPR